MVVRSDISILWHLSPRLIFVDDPSVEVIIQDLHDTLRDLEDEPKNMIYPTIVSSAGKENLGGGVTVGLTSTLQNARLGFEARKVWVSTGTITTTNAAGLTLIDSAATFQTDLVAPGSWIVNLTDGSICSVRIVDSQTQLTTDVLGAGVDNRFDSGDDYRIMNVIQMEVSGGNVVAIDAYGADLDSILPTAGTQVVRTSSASATTQELLDIQFSSFNGGVSVDQVNGTTGTTFPTGTPRQPVKTFADGKTIADSRGFTRFFVLGNATLDTGDDVEGFTVQGDNPARSTITVNAGAATQDVEIINSTVTGVFDTEGTFRDCNLVTIQFVQADIHNCILEGTITLAGTGATSIYNCSDGLVTDAPPPAVDMGGSGRSLAIRDYDGDIQITNKTGTENVEINISTGGRITLDSTVTNGNIRLTGIIEVIDNSGGTAVIDVDQVVSPLEINKQSFLGQVWIDTVGGSSGTIFPKGTPTDRVNNFADAYAIAGAFGINAYHLFGTLALTSTDIVSGTIWTGDTPIVSVLSLDPTATQMSPIRFDKINVTGPQEGASEHNDGIALNISNAKGGYVRNHMSGTITPATTGFVKMFGCWAQDIDGFTLDMDGSPVTVLIVDWHGEIAISNMTNASSSIEIFGAAHVTINPSCTAGTIDIHGVGDLTNNTGGSTVDTVGFLRSAGSDTIENLVLDGYTADHTIVGTVGEALGNMESAQIAANTTVVTGSTSTVIRSSLTQADNFFDGMSIQIINSAGTAIRMIDEYSNTNGAFTVTPAFPFTPAADDILLVLSTAGHTSKRGNLI